MVTAEFAWTLFRIIGIPVLAGMVVGLLLVPSIAFLAGKSAKLEALARVLFTIGQLSTSNGSVLDERSTNTFEPHVVRRDVDGDRYHLRDGDREYLGSETRWTRLGKQPFGITWERTEERLADRTQGTDGIAADGGLGDRQINGRQEWLPGWDDGWVVDIQPYIRALHGSGGNENIETAKEDAKAEYGGDDSLTNMQLILGVGGLFFTGLVMGFLMFGGVL
jgi:hypothetical protein